MSIYGCVVHAECVLLCLLFSSRVHSAYENNGALYESQNCILAHVIWSTVCVCFCKLAIKSKNYYENRAKQALWRSHMRTINIAIAHKILIENLNWWGCDITAATIQVTENLRYISKNR